MFVATGSAVAATTTTSTTANSTSSSAVPSECTNKQSPPAAEDDAEQPAPGTAAPKPLPVPADPVGGDQLGKCGFVLPPDAATAPPSEVNAASWVLADLDTGAVLAAKDPHARQRPAALIKVLLAMVALQDLKPSTPVLITQEDVDAAKGYSAVGVQAGAKFTVTQLVQAMLLKPGNDVPHALARALGGIPKTLDTMNAAAKQMGALDTRVATPGGLDGPGMSTSAYDIAVIYRHAMQLPAFAEAAAVKSVSLGGILVKNADQLMTTYTGAINGITSNTTDAHFTNLSSAAKGGHRLVAVLLRGEQQQYAMYRQSSKLLDYGFTLTAANAHQVGTLVDQAPPVKPSVSSTASSTDSADPTTVQTAADKSPMYQAFGNVGMPLTILAGLVVLAALAMYLRKRRARAARARRLAAQANN
ncbi:D-alanyl-D-alanine carboxypeptidase family protein [Kutzneria kofuensis]|uniref:D-alanyl-D-alanine carboxypeptidase (Penicillin-binding protein 5/6) n=1 Tax=Kutzneria kofuensis TaxID=103725 RepID=A0A7W9KIU5_9PSEU|nr:serine hydrolase [Kutzneria kofuensis]MBB5893413.1 D-alanyl-D-alanine carboxypeptidase (penicillin-binding protein 5/6) [Kutzneria kofuensis]